MLIINYIGILLAIFLIIYLAVKNYSILIVAPIVSIIVILTNQMPLFSTLVGKKNSYLAELADFIINFFGIFLLGAILAKLIEESGAAKTIAEGILKVTGTKKPYSILLAVFIITSILTYGGLSLFVVLFVLVPLAKPLFKKLDIAWNLIGIPVFLGLGTFTMTMLPGSPSVQNVVPTAYLNTTLTAAPWLGLLGSVVAIITGLIYMRFALNKSLAKNEKFSDLNPEVEDDDDNREKSHFFVSILPIIVLILTIFIGSALKVDNIILIALTVSILLCSILFRKYIKEQRKALNEGAQNALMPLFLTASTVGFGAVLTLTDAFKNIESFIFELPISPFIGLAIAGMLFGAITGSASGAVGIVSSTIAPHYVEMGMNPEYAHRIAAIGSSVLTVMPHSGVVLTFMALTGLTQKTGFKYLFVTNVLVNGLAIIAIIIVSILTN